MDTESLYGVIELASQNIDQYAEELEPVKKYFFERGHLSDVYPLAHRDYQLFAGWCKKHCNGKSFRDIHMEEMVDYMNYCAETLRLDVKALQMHMSALSFMYDAYGNAAMCRLFEGMIVVEVRHNDDKKTKA